MYYQTYNIILASKSRGKLKSKSTDTSVYTGICFYILYANL